MPSLVGSEMCIRDRPLMVGIACGTYSSICLASAFWYLLRTRVGGKKAEKDKKAAK